MNRTFTEGTVFHDKHHVVPLSVRAETGLLYLAALLYDAVGVPLLPVE